MQTATHPAAFMARAIALQHYLQAASSVPFAWGRHDCASFALGWVRVARPEWFAPDAPHQAQALAALDLSRATTALQAAHAVKAVAGSGGCAVRNLYAAASAVLGEPVGALLAGVGDLVLLHTPRGHARLAAGRKSGVLGQALGVCVGDLVAVPGPQGLAYVALARREPGRDHFIASGVAAWRV